MNSGNSVTDKDIEKTMGNLLRFGVLISALVVLIGGVLYIFQHGQEPPNYRKFMSEPKRLRDFHQVLEGVLRARGRSIIQLGIFILIATPITRIVFSIIGYFLERDYFYLVLALTVLLIILLNL